MLTSPVQRYMSREVVQVHVGDTLENVVAVMRSHGVTGCPVVDGSGALVGMLSEVDLARTLSLRPGASSLAGFLETLLKAAANETLDPLELLLHRFRHLRAGACMRSPAISVPPEASIEDAAHLLRRHRINRLPVVEAGQLVGIVTRDNILEALDRPAPTPA